MEKEISERIMPLVTKYRGRCLWFLREDFMPETLQDTLRVLDAIERYGDRDAFIEVRRLKSWLSRNFSATSAG